MFDCLKTRLGYMFDPYRLGKCNQIQRKVMAQFYISCTFIVHERNNKLILTV